RLGWGENGIQEIKAHAYFSTIDWEQVSQGNLTPPYIPVFASETDLTHFDETFTTMDPRISTSSGTFPSSSTDPFEGFSY
ncbi:hypothetical protein K501DRAFT_164784, partial [Backusella circina FSU 941]